jgi:hypothetical protein
MRLTYVTNCVDHQLSRRILAVPFDLDVELKIINFFKGFLNHILNQKKIKIEQDVKELKNMMDSSIPFSANDYFACIYRMQQKYIIIKNLELFTILEQIVLTLKDTKNIKKSYMTQFAFEDCEEEFIKNRIILKEYLRYLQSG